MKYLNDNFVELMNSVPENKETLAKMQAEVCDFMEQFHDDPSIISRWGHYYFCDVDGGRIIFDYKKPGVHRCEVCGQTFESEIFDGVWQYFYRNQAIKMGLVSALCFKATGEQKYLDYTKQVISFYADNYLNFALHKKENEVYESYETMEWGCGRIMPQGLNESIIGIRVAQAYEIIKEDIDDAFKQKIFDWFREMFCLLKPQVVQIHNISAWCDTAIAVMGCVRGDQEMMDFAFKSEFGLNNQMAKGVTSDHFWYEGSTHYNYFLLEGVCYAVLFAHLYEYKMDKDCLDTILGMYEMGTQFTFDNGFFPNPNDGWPNLNLKTYSYQYHTIARVMGEDSKYGNMVKCIENMPAPRTILPLSDAYYCDNVTPVEKLLFNIDYDYSDYTPFVRGSKDYPKSNYAMIRSNGLNAFMKYGLNAKSHAHPDIMNSEVVFNGVTFSRDLSNAGYRARLCNEWHRKSLAHNTVVCDGIDIPSYDPGTSLAFDDSHVKATATVYPGVQYTRAMAIEGTTLFDEFVVESEASHNFDYIFHIENTFAVTCDAALEDASLGYTENGYQHVLSTKKVVAAGDSVVVTATSGGVTATMTVDTAGKEMFVLETMDNPVSEKRTSILLRETGANITYKMQIAFAGK